MDTKVDTYLKRRMWKDDGVYYFCRLCGDYLNEDMFYADKDKPFGLSYTCKVHTKKYKKTEEEKEFDHLKMSRITDKDFEETQKLLQQIGYKFGRDEKPVYEQFMIKHGLI